MSEHSWNYLGKFYGVYPQWLASFNGEWDAKPPNAEEMKAARPGDVILLRNYDTQDMPAHSAILTGGPRVIETTDAAGKVTKMVEIRVVDIYGEQWNDVREHIVAAVFRPQKKLSARRSVAIRGIARSTSTAPNSSMTSRLGSGQRLRGVS